MYFLLSLIRTEKVQEKGNGPSEGYVKGGGGKGQEKVKNEKEEEQYAQDAQHKMNQLKEEVNVNIDEFLKSSEAIKKDSAQKEKMLKKLNKINVYN